MRSGIMYNAEGYYDPTAGQALQNVMQKKGYKRMENIKRGEIYYISPADYTTGSEQRAGRPAIVVSNNKNNATSTVIEIVYLTSQIKFDQPTHVTVRSSGWDSTALCEQI